MSNYVEKIKVGTGAAWPVRDAEAHDAINSLGEDVKILNTELYDAVDEMNLRGLGLGGACTVTWSDINAINTPGWYATDDTLVIDGDTFSGAGIRVDPTCGRSIIQTVYPNNEPIVELKRRYANNVWSEWEWVNPPMMLGVEYRTTERFLEEPVYKKIVDLGEIYDNESGHSWEFVSDLDIRGLTSCLDIVLLDGDGNCITNNRTYINDVYADSYDLYVFPTHNAAEDPISNVMAILKYTK